MKFINAAPPEDEGSFKTALSQYDETVANMLAERCGHPISFVQITPSTLRGRGLDAVIHMVPEISRHYGEETSHQMKTVVLVEQGIDYMTPFRRGRLRVKAAGRGKYRPHIAFCDGTEAMEFLKFGSATFVILFKNSGIIGTMEEIVTSLSRMIKTQRVKAVLIVSDQKTPQDEWDRCFHKYGVSVSQL